MLTPTRERGLAAVLLIALAGQLGLAVLADGLTSDELSYIAAGYRHLTAHDYALNAEQPPLAKMAGALSRGPFMRRF